MKRVCVFFRNIRKSAGNWRCSGARSDNQLQIKLLPLEKIVRSWNPYSTGRHRTVRNPKSTAKVRKRCGRKQLVCKRKQFFCTVAPLFLSSYKIKNKKQLPFSRKTPVPGDTHPSRRSCIRQACAPPRPPWPDVRDCASVAHGRTCLHLLPCGGAGVSQFGRKPRCRNVCNSPPEKLLVCLTTINFVVILGAYYTRVYTGVICIRCNMY